MRLMYIFKWKISQTASHLSWSLQQCKHVSLVQKKYKIYSWDSSINYNFQANAIIITEIDGGDYENMRQGHIPVMPNGSGMSSLCIHSTEQRKSTCFSEGNILTLNRCGSCTFVIGKSHSEQLKRNKLLFIWRICTNMDADLTVIYFIMVYGSHLWYFVT